MPVTFRGFRIFFEPSVLNGSQPLADVSTPGHGQGAGPARYEFRSRGTKEIVGGAGVSDANGVPPAVGCLAARSLGHRTKREAGYQSLDFLVSLFFTRASLRF